VVRREQVSGREVSLQPWRVEVANPRYTSTNGDISGLEFSPRDNLIAATTTEGHYVKWTGPIPSSLPDPVITEAARAKNLDKLLDDDFGDGDEDMEDRGDDLDDLHDLGGDDWIVDDDGAYGAEDGEKTRGGRTEVGERQRPATLMLLLIRSERDQGARCVRTW